MAGYRPGQFLTFQVPGPDGTRLTRQWSISDYDPERGDYRISVKREPLGLASRWLHDVAKVGDILPLKAPAGQFALDVGSHKPAIFISGGVGVTPLLAMLKAHAAGQSEPPPPAVWIHATLNGDTHAFRQEVEAAGAGMPHFSSMCFTTSPPRQT